MKMGLRIVASIINISFDGRPPVSLGTAVVDLLTIIPCSSDEMLGSVLCARKAHLFSEQERHVAPKASVGKSISLCKLCDALCLCGENNLKKDSPQRHRGDTENHRD